ncbi:hypothetical protein L596_003119 [Steinernema carpocapsae]|uniref:Uncharacterized protein n=1 Tax=Steinernema carpocapsae TaxID=34508 RepID=A0A4U8URP7_STECR|nr:hypothetical protein L596_003119 [Steinernema carpocapsae]
MTLYENLGKNRIASICAEPVGQLSAFSQSMLIIYHIAADYRLVIPGKQRKGDLKWTRFADRPAGFKEGPTEGKLTN